MNLFFDIDDTLYNQIIPFQRAYEDVCGDRFPDLDIEALFVRNRFRSDEVFQMVRRGELDEKEMYAYRICRAFEDCGGKLDTDSAMAFQHAYSIHQNEIALSDVVKAMLDALSEKNVPLGIISNGPTEHQMHKVERLGLEKWFPRKRIFISGEVGYAKPEKKLFSLIEERLGLSRGDCAFFGDSFAFDVTGAKNAGWTSVWFNRRKNEVPENPSFMPDYVVCSESQMADLAGKLQEK